MSDKLLPCPFCGGSDIELLGNPLWAFWAQCVACGVGTDEAGIRTKRAAVLRWNTRTKTEPDPLLDQMAEALLKLADNNRPYVGEAKRHEIIRFWESEKEQGRGEADDMLAAYAALNAYDARREP